MSLSRKFDVSEFENTIYKDPQRYDDEYWWKSDDFEFWKGIFNKVSGNKVLELASGTGRLAIPLIREGAEYTGIEISPQFCAQSIKKLKSHNMSFNIHEGDIRDFNLNETFDLIFIGFNSFLHLLDNGDAEACLQCVKKHMHEKTLFVIDIFVPNPLFLYRPEIRFPVMEYKDSETNSLVTVEEISVYDPESEINKITWYYNTAQKKDDTIYSFTMRMYFPDTMNRMLVENEFEILQDLGSHNFDEFKESSELQIYICKK